MKSKKYEFMLTLKPSLPENVRVAVLDKIEGLMKDLDLKVVNQDVWGKRYLSYVIKKHKEGYYILYNLEAGENFVADNVDKLIKSARVVSEIIRFGIFSVKKFSTVKIQKNV